MAERGVRLLKDVSCVLLRGSIAVGVQGCVRVQMQSGVAVCVDCCVSLQVCSALCLICAWLDNAILDAALQCCLGLVFGYLVWIALHGCECAVFCVPARLLCSAALGVRCLRKLGRVYVLIYKWHFVHHS